LDFEDEENEEEYHIAASPDAVSFVKSTFPEQYFHFQTTPGSPG